MYTYSKFNPFKLPRTQGVKHGFIFSLPKPKIIAICDFVSAIAQLLNKSLL